MGAGNLTDIVVPRLTERLTPEITAGPIFNANDYANAAIWLDASDRKTLAFDPVTGRVESLIDKTGNGNDFTQTTDVEQNELGSAILNTKDGLIGTASTFYNSSYVQTPSTVGASFCVFKTPSDLSTDLGLFGAVETDATLFIQVDEGGGTPRMRFGSVNSTPLGSTTILPNTVYLVELLISSGAIRGFLNGNAEVSQGKGLGAAQTVPWQFMTINGMAGENFTGIMGELFHVERNINQNSDEHLEIRQRLAKKWNILLP